MRTLNTTRLRRLLKLSLFPALASIDASAAISSFSVQHQQSRGGNLLSQGTAIQSVDSSTQSLLLNLNELPWGTGLGLQLNQTSPDYSNTLIRSDSGEERPLSAISGEKPEYSALISAVKIWGSHTASLSVLQTLTDSPFALTAFGFGWTESWFAAAYQWGVQTQLMSQKQPGSTFLDRDQKQKNRPEEVRGYQLSTFFDSVLTERAKNRIEVGTSRRIEERPLNVWIRDRFGYAIHDRVFARVEARRAQELRQGLQNERGYFELSQGTVSLSFEPTYGFLISPSFGVLIEREDDPRIETLTQTGTDQYGLSLELNLKNTQISSTLVRELSNTKSHATLVTAGVTWTL